MSFPKNFLWGGATSASQCEGMYNANGRGLSNIDVCPLGENRSDIIRGKNVKLEPQDNEFYPSHEAIKMGEHLEEDLKLFHEMGFKAYRFSISWPRIFPKGTESKPNEEGLKFYDKLIDLCLEYNMEPIVTISHFEVPLNLVKEIGSWKSRQMIDYYLKLCEVLFTRYKGKVHYWLPFNEINMLLHAPFMGAGIVLDGVENEDEVLYNAAHYELVANARAIKLAHEIDENNKVGAMFAAGSVYPRTCKPEDVFEALEVGRSNYFFVDIEARGKYPNYALKMFEQKG